MTDAPELMDAEVEDPSTLPALLVKRYASRRLYNTETSDYVTLEDIAAVIRSGREVRIVDLKSGDDLTRQYMLQIIVDHESRGKSVLPLGVLTDLVRSYTTTAQSMVPQFLAASFEILREGQSNLADQMTSFPEGTNGISGLDTTQQQEFLKTMMSGWQGDDALSDGDQADAASSAGTGRTASEHGSENGSADEMSEIRRQLAELQSRVAKL